MLLAIDDLTNQTETEHGDSTTHKQPIDMRIWKLHDNYPHYHKDKCVENSMRSNSSTIYHPEIVLNNPRVLLISSIFVGLITYWKDFNMLL